MASPKPTTAEKRRKRPSLIEYSRQGPSGQRLYRKEIFKIKANRSRTAR